MSEPLPPGEGGDAGNPVMRRVAGLPIIVWVIIVAIAAYLFISRRSGGSAVGPSTSGGGGSASESGTTTIDKGAVQITVTQNPLSKGKQKQPGPPVRKKKHLVTVPNVIGEPWPLAERKLRARHLTPERKQPYSGATKGETPEAGKKVQRGSKVELTGVPPGH